MKRIAVIGCPGSGKSGLSVKMGALLGLAVIHLDSIYWHPGWVPTPEKEWAEIVKGLTEGGSWIIDGNYRSTLSIRLAAADTIVFMDFPRRVCVWRIIKRRLTYIGRTRPDMAPGCPEKLIDLPFFKFIWNFEKETRPHVLQLIKEKGENAQVVTLKTADDVRRFLDGLQGTQESKST